MIFTSGSRAWDQTFQPDIVAAAYLTGDVIGTIQAVPNMSQSDYDANWISRVTVTDKTHSNVALDLYFFNKPLATVPTDNAAFNVPTAEANPVNGIAKYIGKIPVAAGDALSGLSLQQKDVSPEFLYKTIRNRTLYVVVVARGGVTYTSTTDLTITLSTIQSE